jgi:hypothetical protein
VIALLTGDPDASAPYFGVHRMQAEATGFV